MHKSGRLFVCDRCNNQDFIPYEHEEDNSWIHILINDTDPIDLCPDCAKKFDKGMSQFMDTFNELLVATSK